MPRTSTVSFSTNRTIRPAGRSVPTQNQAIVHVSYSAEVQLVEKDAVHLQFSVRMSLHLVYRFRNASATIFLSRHSSASKNLEKYDIRRCFPVNAFSGKLDGESRV